MIKNKENFNKCLMALPFPVKYMRDFQPVTFSALD